MKTKRRKARRLPETQIRLQQLTDEIRALATRVSDLQAAVDRMAAVNGLPPYRERFVAPGGPSGGTTFYAVGW